MERLSIVMKCFGLKGKNFSKLARVLIPYAFLHANFDDPMGRTRPKFLHESFSFMCLVCSCQILASWDW